ncbi:MAG: acyl carrier protein [Christensenellaceae bacterium]|jgi:acyl carrier protein
MEEKIIEIVAKVLKKDPASITRNTKMSDVKEWDSLAQVMILAEIEETLGLYIPIDKSFGIEDVAGLLSAVEK